MSEKSTKPTLSVEIKPDEVETYRQSLTPTVATTVGPRVVAIVLATLAFGAFIYLLTNSF